MKYFKIAKIGIDGSFKQNSHSIMLIKKAMKDAKFFCDSLEISRYNQNCLIWIGQLWHFLVLLRATLAFRAGFSERNVAKSRNKLQGCLNQINSYFQAFMHLYYKEIYICCENNNALRGRSNGISDHTLLSQNSSRFITTPLLPPVP